ncbi:hypothetical protein HRbin30_02135 [bacterium HR30]|nr:hypothetical protein HRbin30_02135 [bacterium HR30]
MGRWRRDCTGNVRHGWNRTRQHGCRKTRHLTAVGARDRVPRHGRHAAGTALAAKESLVDRGDDFVHRDFPVAVDVAR